jgi:hypothetical protein
LKLSNKQAKKDVFILSTYATIGTIVVVVAFTFAFLAIEKAYGDWPNFVWGIISILFACTFALFYILGFRILDKRRGNKEKSLP